MACGLKAAFKYISKIFKDVLKEKVSEMYPLRLIKGE